MNDYALKIYSLSKSYIDKKVVLSGLSLDVKKGNLVAIVGKNGAGKSTLFKCIAGILYIDDGYIKLNVNNTDTILNSSTNFIKRDIRKKIGMIFQDSALWPHMNILDNIKRPLIDIHDFNTSEAINKAQEWLGKLNVAEEYFNKFPRELSGGMVRRVAIARTFACDPDLILIDEIEANLDPEAIENVLLLIEDSFIKDPQKTILVVTHRIDFLTRCASSVMVLDKGSIFIQGPPYEVLEIPNTEKAPFLKNIVDPSRSEWIFGYHCLESAIKISSLSLEENGKRNIFQKVINEISNLIVPIEKNQPHMITIVIRGSKDNQLLLIKGIFKSKDFILDGDSVSSLGKLVEPKKLCDNLIEEYKFTNDFQNILMDDNSEKFDTGDEFSGSLIALMFTDRRFELQYEFASYPPIPGVFFTQVPVENPIARLQYYEFSKKTKAVYLFPMEWQEQVIGVISIDTYSSDTWLPFVVKQLKLIANLGAIAIKNKYDI